MRLLKPTLLVLLVAMVTGCGEVRWSQFHADGPNRGFVSVHSGKASPTKAKWRANVGPVLFSSPAVDNDGAILIGNVNGQLVAVNPDGTPKLTFTAVPPNNPVIYSSPAVSTSGVVYFIVNYGGTPKGPAHFLGESTLFALDHTKRLQCTFPFPAGSVTTSSPKTFTSGGHVNIFAAGIEGSPFSGALRVFDEMCNPIAFQTWDCPHDVVGGGTSLIWDELLHFFTGGLYDIALLATNSPSGFHIDPAHQLLDPSPAVIDSPAEAGKVIVVAGVTACGLHTFTWDPSASVLTPKWVAPNARNSISSPAISPSRDQVVVGQDDGHVLAFDLLTGKLLWDYNAGEIVMATPAFFSVASQVYVVSETHVQKIDNDGGLVRRISFPPALSSAGMSLDHMYITSDDGLYTLSYDLTIESRDAAAAHGGSSPAVGPDGTVYSVGADNMLRAYGP